MKNNIHSDLANGTVLAKDVVHFLGRDFKRQVPKWTDSDEGKEGGGGGGSVQSGAVSALNA